jgi:hypothetical protein
MNSEISRNADANPAIIPDISCKAFNRMNLSVENVRFFYRHLLQTMKNRNIMAKTGHNDLDD